MAPLVRFLHEVVNKKDRHDLTTAVFVWGSRLVQGLDRVSPNSCSAAPRMSGLVAPILAPIRAPSGQFGDGLRKTLAPDFGPPMGDPYVEHSLLLK